MPDGDPGAVRTEVMVLPAVLPAVHGVALPVVLPAVRGAALLVALLVEVGEVMDPVGDTLAFSNAWR